MPSLLATLNSAAGSMRTIERALAMIQNNVSNASTPGYARQQIDLVSLAFQPDLELTGGVAATRLASARSGYAEISVRQQAQRYGRLSQMATTAGQLEPIFPVGENSGIAGALNRFYGSFSQLGVTPNDTPSRENVLRRAEDVARNFNTTTTSLLGARDHAGREVRSVVEGINRLARVVRDINVEIRQDYRKLEDAGLDGRLHAALEELAELADVNVVKQEDGTVAVLLGGQTPLVFGDKAMEIEADFSSSQIAIRSTTGTDITSQLSEGRLAGLLEVANTHIPTYLADLNRLAQSFADRVNGILAGGIDRTGQPPTVDLFTYNAAGGEALTLAVSGITPDELAAAKAAAPGGDDNALDLAALATSREIDGFSFSEFYGRIGAEAGRLLSAAREDAETQSQLLAQARSLREEVSGVDLDAEAASLIQFQRAYQATAQFISVLNSLTETVFSILPR